MLDGHQNSASPFTPDAEALRHSQEDKQNRRPYSDVVVGRKTTDQESRDAHDQQGEDQHRLAANLVPVVTANDPADWPCGKPDGIGAERSECARQGVIVREKELVEDECAGGSVKEKVVPLDGRAYEAGNCDPADR